MRSPRALVAALLVLSACLGCRSRSGEEAGEGEGRGGAPAAKVRTATIERRAVVEVVEAFGTAAASPGAARTLSVPFEARVRRVAVTEGAPVVAGAELIEIEPTPDTELQLAQARDENAAAGEQKTLVEERLDLKLSTRPDLQQSEQRLRAAEIRRRNLERRGEGPRTLRAGEAGTVLHVDAQPGQVVAAGAPLLETVPERGVSVRLGVESAEAPRVRAGQAVRLSAVGGGAEGAGRVALVARAVNPQTRLVDVFVGPESAVGFRLNEYVRGAIETGRHDALVVPREAIVPEQDRAVLFTVVNGRAVRREVRTGIDDGRVVEVSGEGLDSGAAVVVEGAAELQDGMTVEADGAR